MLDRLHNLLTMRKRECLKSAEQDFDQLMEKIDDDQRQISQFEDHMRAQWDHVQKDVDQVKESVDVTLKKKTEE